MGGRGSGRKKGQPIEIPNEGPDPEEFTVSEKMGNVMETIARMGDQVEAVMLNEWNTERKKREYLMTIPVEQFSLDYVREQFGGGDYIVSYLDEQGAVCGNGAFTISKKFTGKTATPAPDGLPKTMDPNVALAVAQMTGHTKGLEMLVQSQGAMMTAMLNAMGNGRKEKDSDPLDVGLRIAEIIKESRPAGGTGLGVKEMAETFREGLTLGQSIVNPEKGLGDVLEPLIPAVGRALESAAEQGKVLPLQPRAPKAATPKQEQPAVDLTKAPWLAHLRPFINEIATWAQNGWDPESYITSMTARLPDNVMEEIFEASKSPTFIEDALASMPLPFQAYKSWLTRALTELREQVKPEEEPVAGGPNEEEDEDEDE